MVVLWVACWEILRAVQKAEPKVGGWAGDSGVNWAACSAAQLAASSVLTSVVQWVAGRAAMLAVGKVAPLVAKTAGDWAVQSVVP